MPELSFASVAGKWEGNDYPNVSMTSVAIGNGVPLALIYMTHMNVDFDGAPNAYGPPTLNPLDSLEDAGRFGENGYYGLMAVGPKEVLRGDHKKRLIKDVYHLQLDENYPASADGKCPVVQQTGPYKGYYVSTTAKRNPSGSASIYEQSHYRDSASIEFCALSYGLTTKGVGDQDMSIALRHDTFRTTTFPFMAGEGHPKGSKHAYAVGECSYKVFLNFGGQPKQRTQKYPKNEFPSTFVVFPGSRTSKLQQISMAENADDFAVFLALQAAADKAHKGRSGLPAFKKYIADGRKTKPATYANVASALQQYGYSPLIGAALNAASSVASSIVGAARQVIP
jgi:hypothetical protein